MPLKYDRQLRTASELPRRCQRIRKIGCPYRNHDGARRERKGDGVSRQFFDHV